MHAPVHAPDAAPDARSATVTSLTPLRIDIPRKDSPGLGVLLRDAVEAGAPDGPAEVFIDGRLIFTIRRLHAAALFTVVEEPTLRRIPWTPHPRAKIGPRVQALLDARTIDRRLRKEYGA